MKNYHNVDEFLACATKWQEEMSEVRDQLLKSGLDEAVKWGKPCFSYRGKNVAILQPMKNFLSLLFVKGALIDDPKGLLEEQGPNTRSARRVCFRSLDNVKTSTKSLKALVRSAVEVEREGRELPQAPDLILVDELSSALEKKRKLKSAFEALTPGRQREYNMHISSAKQSKTRTARIEKLVPRILAGKGLRDRWEG